MLVRLLAAVAAVAMVFAAVAARARFDDREESAVARGTTLRLVCSTELAQACNALATAAADGPRIEVTVEEAAVTATRLAAPDAGASGPVDGWLVAGPWTTFVAGARQRAGLDPVLKAGPVLARSPVVLVVWPERGKALAGRCPGNKVAWRCLGESAGRPWADLGGMAIWGEVKPGHARSTTAVGLAVVGAATLGFFGRTDVAGVDLDDDDYRDWLARLERSIPSHPRSPLEDMLLRGPGAFDAVGTIEAEARTLISGSARPDKPEAIYPSPVATTDVTLGAAPGRRGRLLSDLVQGREGKKALDGAGWRVPGKAGTPALASPSDLPPGLLDALRVVVREAGG